MTEHEAKSCIQGKLDCMNKCDVFNCKDTEECDGCNYCYSQGNFGEQKQAFEMAIKTLEKQIPKKPLYGIVNSYMACHCPICMGFVCFADMGKSNYCSVCGQKLDWKGGATW